MEKKWFPVLVRATERTYNMSIIFFKFIFQMYLNLVDNQRLILQQMQNS